MAEATLGTIAQSSPFDLQHLSPCIGTEVLGIDLREDQPQSIIDHLSQLLVERKVLFFREQALSREQHIAFSRRFGELEVHPFTRNNAKHPELIELHNDRERPPNINVWHSDVTWRAEPSLGSLLRARVVPEVGGDTLFANMEAAYDALDESTRAQIDELEAVHDNEPFLAGMRSAGASAEKVAAMQEQFPPATHPVVRTHPVSGRKSIYVNRTFTRYIKGYVGSRFRATSAAPLSAGLAPRSAVSVSAGEPDSIAFWDNRAAQHYAAADYWPATRQMERVTIVGQKPY